MCKTPSHSGLITFHFLFRISLPPQVESINTQINGNVLKNLSPTECDLMFVTPTNVFTCRDNYNWTITPTGLNVTSVKKFVPIGMNSLWPCAIGNI